MKKNLLFLSIGVYLIFSLNSCKSELDLDKELKFSKLSVEEQKQKIEDNGTKLIDAFNGMQDTKGMLAIQEFLSVQSNISQAAPIRILSAGLKAKNLQTLTNFDKQLRASAIETGFWGEWNYNATTNQMDLVKELTNKSIIHFPATANSKTNNGLVTITYTESGVNAINSTEKYPSAITFSMTVDSKTVIKADFSGTYYNDGTPKKVSQTFEMDDYKWTASIDNDQKKASESYEFKKGSTTLIKAEAVVEGVLTVDKIENTDMNQNPEAVINSFAVNCQMMNIAIKGGTTDFKAMATALKEIQDLSEVQYLNAQATILNKYMVAYAYFTDDKRKFADVEFYVYEGDPYQSYEYNYQTGEYAVITVTDFYMQPRMVLSDGSKVDVDEYFNDGFEGLIDQINDLNNSFEY